MLWKRRQMSWKSGAGVGCLASHHIGWWHYRSRQITYALDKKTKSKLHWTVPTRTHWEDNGATRISMDWKSEPPPLESEGTGLEWEGPPSVHPEWGGGVIWWVSDSYCVKTHPVPSVARGNYWNTAATVFPLNGSYDLVREPLLLMWLPLYQKCNEEEEFNPGFRL